MFLFDIYCTENFYVFAAQRQRKGRIKMVSQEWRQCQPIVSPGTLILMGNSAFALQSVVWPWRLNNGVKHHAKRFHSGVRPANEEVQLGGDRVRAGCLNDIVQLMALFTIEPGALGKARNAASISAVSELASITANRRSRRISSKECEGLADDFRICRQLRHSWRSPGVSR